MSVVRVVMCVDVNSNVVMCIDACSNVVMCVDALSQTAQVCRQSEFYSHIHVYIAYIHSVDRPEPKCYMYIYRIYVYIVDRPERW